jgi:hypothetical protein
MNSTNENTENTLTKWEKFADTFNKTASLIQWILMVAMIIGGYLLYQRDTATVQAQTIRDLQAGQTETKKTIEDRKKERDTQFLELERKILTKEMFDIYQKNNSERMDRIEKMLEKLLEK